LKIKNFWHIFITWPAGLLYNLIITFGVPAMENIFVTIPTVVLLSQKNKVFPVYIK
jgi:hypothetical protein